MRENRTSGSEGGEAQTNELSLPLSPRSATDHLEAGVPSVRSGLGQSRDNQTVQNFRYKVLRELAKIKLAWPGPELCNGSVPPDPLSICPAHSPDPWAGTGLDLTLRRD